MTNSPKTILISSDTSATARRKSHQEIDVNLLATNVNVFLTQIEGILESTPDNVGKFKLKEFSITAEVTAKGTLSIVGSGIEAAGKGGLIFKFVRD